MSLVLSSYVLKIVVWKKFARQAEKVLRAALKGSRAVTQAQVKLLCVKEGDRQVLEVTFKYRREDEGALALINRLGNLSIIPSSYLAE